MNGDVQGRADGEDKGRLVGQAVAPAQTIDRPPEDDDNRYHVSASPSESPEAHVLKHDDTFAVLDRFGDISRSGDKQEALPVRRPFRDPDPPGNFGQLARLAAGKRHHPRLRRAQSAL